MIFLLAGYNPDTDPFYLILSKYISTVLIVSQCCQDGKYARTLRWRHNGHDCVSNHQPRHCLLNRLLERRSKETSKLRVTGLCAGNSPGPVNSPHKGPVTRKMFPFDDAIMNSAASIPLRAKFFRGNINIYLHFMSFLHIDLTLIWKHWTSNMLVRHMLSSVCLRLSHCSQISFIQYMELWVFSLPSSLMMIMRMCTLS